MSALDHLTEMQRKFVEAYLVGGNASEAYRTAGYTSTGKAIGNNAARLIGSERIKTALAERRAQMVDANAVTPERVLAELALLAFSDVGEHATWGAKSVQMRAKTFALDKLGTHLGLWTPTPGDTAQVSITITF